MGNKGIRIKDIDHLRRVLKKAPLKIDAAFLFGSRASGESLKESDWDVRIVSPEFHGISFPDRATFVMKKLPLRRVELLCYTPKEFKARTNEIGIVAEAIKGVRLI